MQAIVSGQAGLAVLIDGESIYSIEANDPGVDTPRDRTDLLHLFAGATDVVEFPVEDRAAAVRRLQFDWNCDRALRMTLILLDPEEDSETRVLAAECVENRLSDEAVRNWLVARLYQAPMPDAGDLAGAIDLTASDELPLIQKLLIELQTDQPHIEAAVEAWDEVAVPTGGNSLNKPELFDRLIAAGACYQVARAAAGGKASSATFDVLGHPGIKSLPGIGPVVSSWIKILSATPEPVLKEQPVDKKAAKKLRKTKARQSRKPAAEDSAGGTGHERFQRWEKEFESIVAQIDGDKLSNARKFLDQLIQRQVAEGNRELAGKTASKLATEMKVRSRTELRLEFARLAVDVNSEDPQVHNQLAEALREVGETSEAITVYRETVARFPRDAVCRNGLAETLREVGETSEAITVYRETVIRFPQDEVCRNGLAETLREVGESSEAISVYRETIARFPQDVVCRCGLAETLREVGESSEAISVYRETVALFPQNAVCRCGLAETLREVGEFSEAISVYRETVARFPRDEVCRNGLSETLREVGETSEAISVYRETVARFPRDAVCRNGLAETLREVGETSEAIKVYRETVARFPENVVCWCGLAETLREVGETSEAISVYRETVALFPQNVVCKCGLAETLREVGESSEAISVYRETVARFPQNEVCRSGLAVMLAEDSKFDEALELLPVESPKTHQELIGWHIRGMVYLQRKDMAAAVATFKIGLERSRQERDKSYHRNALASAYLRTGQHREAVELLEGASDELSDLFRAHALGELEDRELVKQALDRLRGTTRPEVRELRNEFEEVYVQNDPQGRRSSADWLDHVFQREFELLRDATRSMHRQSAV